MAMMSVSRFETRPSLRARRGFTLAEAMVSMLVVSVMLVAALDMVGSSARTRQVQVSGGRALALASDLMAAESEEEETEEETR